jgi:hypothetical protein
VVGGTRNQVMREQSGDFTVIFACAGFGASDRFKRISYSNYVLGSEETRGSSFNELRRAEERKCVIKTCGTMKFMKAACLELIGSNYSIYPHRHHRCNLITDLNIFIDARYTPSVTLSQSLLLPSLPPSLQHPGVQLAPFPPPSSSDFLYSFPSL